MYVLATSPEFQFFAFWRYQLDELSSLENGHCRLELERFPEILKNMIRKYNEDGLVSLVNIRLCALSNC